MLNIGKLRPGGENYYLNSVARGAEDYYLNAGESPGYWLTSGAAQMGLSGKVGEDELRAVLRGSHPASSQQLVKSGSGQRVPGFDLTFRAPKSVALLHALGPKEASNQVVSAHDSAVAAALGYLERQASGARRGKGGKRSIASEGFISAGFRHRTSRAGDPLLHTHVVTANLIKGEDGKWGALDARHLYKQAKTAGYLYQAHLRAELSRRLGVQWAPVVKGSADIEGISRPVIRAFSTRRAEIERQTALRGEGSGRAAQVAALHTRRAKDYGISPETLAPSWRERAEQLGLTSQVLEATMDRGNYKEPAHSDLQAIASRLASPQGLTAQESAFSRREALQGFCSELQGGADIETIEAMTEAFLGTDFVIALSVRAGGVTTASSRRVSEGRIAGSMDEPRYSTAEMLAVEQAVIERVMERRLDGAGVAASSAIEASLARRPSLYEDQQAMVRRLTTSGLGVEVVVGKAGAGKTFALDAAREAWQASGHSVIGCSLSARAARELEAGSGIHSSTIAQLLQDLSHDERAGLGPNSVLVVDEAGMVGTRSLDRLLTHAQHAHAKVVLVGDDRQLPEIEAGGAFRSIKNRLPAIELSEVRRQPFGWERDALDLVREGRAKEAIDQYTRHGRVHAGPSAEETRQQLVADWWTTQRDPEPGVMIAARKSDVYDLNARARELMQAAGTLGRDEIEIAGQSFAVGDRVMTLRNSRRLGVDNGTRAVVEKIDPSLPEVTIRRGDGAEVRLPQGYLEAGQLTHSYAITGHKAQGMTTEKGFVLGDETLYREWAYVAMSRGKQNNSLYVVTGLDPGRDEVGGEVAKAEDPTTDLIRALGRSRAKDLAIDIYEQKEIRNLTYAELRLEWEAIGRSLAGVPADPKVQLEEIPKQRRRLEALLEQESAVGLAARQEARSTGFLARLRAPARASRLDRDVVDAARNEARMRSEIEGLGDMETSLSAQGAEREQWLLENSPVIRRRYALERELWWREHQQALGAEVDMPRYLGRAAGASTTERSRWDEALRSIEDHQQGCKVQERATTAHDEIKVEEKPDRLQQQEVELDVLERSIEL